MHAAPPLLSLLLILLCLLGWSHGLCKLENNTMASCHKLQDIKYIDTHYLEFLSAPVMRDTLTPDSFDNSGNLDNLKHLDLSGGDLRNIESGSFRNFTNLRSLNLGDNRIEYLGLASLEGLIHLRSLNLRKNAIRQLPPVLMRLKNLRHLDIHGNPLECNCATLKVRDLIVRRGVTLSKKIVCVSPNNMKGTSLMKPNATIICNLEEQDREMQNDQAEGSGADPDSDNALDALAEEDEGETEYEKIDDDSEKPRETEVETSFPAVSTVSTTIFPANDFIAPSKEITVASEESSGTTTSSLQPTTEDEEIFFDGEDKKEQPSPTTEMTRRMNVVKDALFYPVEGSGDEEEASGEGSGTDWLNHDEEKPEDDDTNEPSIWSVLFGTIMGNNVTPSETKDPDLEEEQFIDVSTSTKLATEKPMILTEIHPVKSDIGKVTTEEKAKATTVSITNNVEVMKPASDNTKSGNVKAEVDSLNDELAEVSSAKQSKKGMGSYVVLAILLAVLATLIGFAAYKGNFCRKKKKRSEVENGTELKDMQKSLLPDAGNATQPKIASNGNAENVPLVEAPDENVKVDKGHGENYQTQEASRSLNGTADHPDPVKPPRKLITPQDESRKVEERQRVDVNFLKENFLADRVDTVQPSLSSSILTNNGPTMHISEPNGPPLSPGAQRVRITLQEIPDSVPKTPILITRTMAGENLVKTP